MKKKIIAAALSAALLLTSLGALSGCAAGAQEGDLTKGLEPNTIAGFTGDGINEKAALAEFALTLFQKSVAGGDNGSVSPLSVILALAMTANGAGGDTLKEMEAAFGLSLSDLNAYLKHYTDNLPENEKAKLSLANSIWLREGDGLEVSEEFLQTNADFYGASVFKEAFDKATVKKINGWVSEETNGMIKDILDEIPNEAVLYLVNALAFEAEWENPYYESRITDGQFTDKDDKSKTVEMMYGVEYQYLEDDDATGFIKTYAGGEYAFAALLPNEGVTIDDYIASLTGEGLLDTLASAEETKVNTATPKFEAEYAVTLNDALIAMGMKNAFDGKTADFSKMAGMANGNLYIGRVLHKTYISVDGLGTKAGASTAVQMEATSAEIEEPKTVYLDRPFVYMLIDCETNLPFFIGAVTDIGI